MKVVSNKKPVKLSDKITWYRHRFDDEDTGEIYYQLMECHELDPFYDGDIVYVHGPNAKQNSFKLLDILNNRTRITP